MRPGAKVSRPAAKATKAAKAAKAAKAGKVAKVVQAATTAKAGQAATTAKPVKAGVAKAASGARPAAGRAPLLGLLVPSIANPFFAVLASEIERPVPFHVRGDALTNIFDVRPCGGRTAGHDARAVARAFFAAAHSGADVKQPFRFAKFHAAVRVIKK